jgi:hypothetical protein
LCTDSFSILLDQAQMERRQYPRQSPMKGLAYIYLDKRIPLAECEVTNVSEGGARIVWKSSEMLPARFVLLLTLDGGERRSCRVVWRNGADIGVAFEGLD